MPTPTPTPTPAPTRRERGCTLTDRLTVLPDDGTGRIRPSLVPLFGLLVAMDKPRSGLAWP
ncbi:hypothetical protein ACFWFI_07930 [Streptomyces sp. NPDC060209]|uniref:hypothetical protein n=1 Tax=Streptomyces sp. NPDC060209 TaxID=3347073 RepID=UPI00365A9EA6